MEQLLTQEQVTALLGRSLTKAEANNFQLYLEIATERLQDLLCITLTKPLQPGLQLLLPRCFDAIRLEQSQARRGDIKTKKVEDFDISYETNGKSPMERFVATNGADLEKYSQCQAPIRQGKLPNGNGIRLLYLD